MHPQVRTRGDDQGRFMLGPSILSFPARIKELPLWSRRAPSPEIGADGVPRRPLVPRPRVLGRLPSRQDISFDFTVTSK
jgi:hypothetical protein